MVLLIQLISRLIHQLFRFETFTKRFNVIRVAKSYNLIGDTLRLYDNNRVNKVHRDFLINTLIKDQLTLTPIDDNAKDLIRAITLRGNRDKLVFREIHQFYTDTIRFEKIILKTVGGYHLKTI